MWRNQRKHNLHKILVPFFSILFLNFSILFKEKKNKVKKVYEESHSEIASSCLRDAKQKGNDQCTDHRASRLLTALRGLLFLQLVAKVLIICKLL